MDSIALGLILALLAGLSTTLGGLLVFTIKKFDKKYLAFALAFSSGVMITVSFIELLPAGIKTLGYTQALTLFFAGSAVGFLVDHFVPHEFLMEKVGRAGKAKNSALLRLGLFTALGLAIHNFPEGIAIFAGNLQSSGLGVTIALAIAIHNIPEGVAVSVPVYFATKSKRKAIWTSFLSGVAEPIGAVIGALLLIPFLSAELVGMCLAIVAGIMIYICIDELLPAAVLSCGKNHHLMTFGFILGSIVMGITLIMLS